MFLLQKHDNCTMTEETAFLADLADCFANKSSLQFSKYIIITLKVERRIKAILNLPIKKIHFLGPAFRGVVANSSSSVVTPIRTPSSPYPLIHTCPLRGFSVSNQKQAGLEDALAGNYEKKTIPPTLALFLNEPKFEGVCLH